MTAAPASFADIVQRLSAAPVPNVETLAAAEARNANLTKPAGALGRLEEIAIWFAGWRGAPQRDGASAQALVFAGNHGVAARGVSAFPSDVTAQMVANFKAGGAAINQLCRQHDIPLAVTPIRLEEPTADFTEAPALDEAGFFEALALGWESVDPAADILILGEMGIGNTTAAAAIAAALFGGDLAQWVGRGAGLDDVGLARKSEVISGGLALHLPAIEASSAETRGLQAAQRLGGRELAAILGAALRARLQRQIVLLDGVIATAAIAPLHFCAEGALAHCLAAHRSVEPAHGAMLSALGLSPLLDLGLRLGEGSGAALALGVVQSALRLHAGMATFEEAAVSGPGA
ncbi:MAG: nicotinate-nucleotide--dimethylbenzimidazole phosphoribosyltransferase [Neomegalonema sp.]|nr:nicotinate-nucleotide--dimethylbenzimidazole phosphoribosyltransferase [Neomegalonema sp.]